MGFETLIYEDATGMHTPDYSAVLGYYQDQNKLIYGDDINLDSDTKDGQFIGVFALSAYDLCNIAQTTYNGYSPLTAIGRALSTQVKINGIAREVATYSSVDLYIVGQVGTEIVNGVASDSLNQKWNLPASVVIPISGDITVTATADSAGNVSAAPDTITSIYTPTRGWQSVNNPSAATAGAPVESDAALRVRQTESVAQPARTVFESTVGLVASVEGVTRYRGYENDTNSTDSNGIPAHTISLVVQGGDDMAIAQAIWDKKTPGTGTYGTTEETIYDGFGTPDTIKFYRPTEATIGVNIEIEALAGYVSTTEDLIKASVAEYINASRIGDDVYLSRIYTPANLASIPEGETYDITLLEINKNAGAFAAANVDLLFNEIAICSVDDVTVTVV